MKNLKPFLAPIIVAVLALAGLASCQGSTFRESIEAKLTDSSAAALAAAGFDDAVVRFVGRDATVEADTVAVAAAAGGVVREVEGVRFVRSLGPDGEVEPDATAAGDTENGAEDSDADESAESDDAGEGSSKEGTSNDSESDDDGPDATPAAEEPQEPTTQEKEKAQDDLVKIPNITFVTPDSTTLTDDGKKVIRHAAEVLAKHPAVHVRIDGHTDHVGSAEHNEKLSQRRAQVVVERLIDHGVDADRLTAKGFGESEPVIEHAEDLKELGKNRRVEFTVTSGR